jgi:hypothetical protein
MLRTAYQVALGLDRAKRASWEGEDGSNKLEDTADYDAEEAEGQEDQPDDGIEDQRRQSDGPADDQEDQEEEKFHGRLSFFELYAARR